MTRPATWLALAWIGCACMVVFVARARANESASLQWQLVECFHNPDAHDMTGCASHGEPKETRTACTIEKAWVKPIATGSRISCQPVERGRR